MKIINRDIRKTITPKMPMLIEGCKTHDELCRKFLQHEYVCNKNSIICVKQQTTS